MWTKDEIETAIRMRGDGFSSAMIALKVGRTRNAVVGKLWKMGVKPGGIYHRSKNTGVRATQIFSARTWTDEKLTETWADRKIRRAQERAAA